MFIKSNFSINYLVLIGGGFFLALIHVDNFIVHRPRVMHAKFLHDMNPVTVYGFMVNIQQVAILLLL
jgi:hypothetical protein